MGCTKGHCSCSDNVLVSVYIDPRVKTTKKPLFQVLHTLFMFALHMDADSEKKCFSLLCLAERVGMC